VDSSIGPHGRVAGWRLVQHAEWLKHAPPRVFNPPCKKERGAKRLKLLQNLPVGVISHITAEADAAPRARERPGRSERLKEPPKIMHPTSAHSIGWLRSGARGSPAGSNYERNKGRRQERMQIHGGPGSICSRFATQEDKLKTAAPIRPAIQPSRAFAQARNDRRTTNGHALCQI